jgi:hypothetical protein
LKVIQPQELFDFYLTPANQSIFIRFSVSDPPNWSAALSIKEAGFFSSSFKEQKDLSVEI